VPAPAIVAARSLLVPRGMEVDWAAQIVDDERWLEASADVQWDDSDDGGAAATADVAVTADAPAAVAAAARPAAPAGGAEERVVAAAQVCVYELEGEGWRALAGGAWTTLSLGRSLFFSRGVASFGSILRLEDGAPSLAPSLVVGYILTAT